MKAVTLNMSVLSWRDAGAVADIVIAAAQEAVALRVKWEHGITEVDSRGRVLESVLAADAMDVVRLQATLLSQQASKLKRFAKLRDELRAKGC